MKSKTPFYRKLHNQVILAALAGILLGELAPEIAVTMKPLGDGYIKIVKMMIAPIVFCVISSGIAGMGSMKAVGTVGGKTLAYFLSFSTLALIVGLLAADVFQPGTGMNVDAAALDHDAVKGYATAAHAQGIIPFILGIIPENFVGALTQGSVLQVLLVAILFGFALRTLGERAAPVKDLIHRTTKVFFVLVEFLVLLSPLGAFGAMSFTIGAFGLQTLVPLLAFISTYLLTCILFVLVILVPAAMWAGFSVFRMCRYIFEEILIQMSVASSEIVMPRLMEKYEKLGISKGVVGLVVPAGYSFNLQGTNIYMTFSVVFIAQALNMPLTFEQQVTIILVALMTSKAATGFANAGFIVLAATLSVVPTVPVAGLALILGIDPFMSRLRGLANIIGNAVAVGVIAVWSKDIDRADLRLRLAAGPDMDVAAAKQL